VVLLHAFDAETPDRELAALLADLLLAGEDRELVAISISDADAGDGAREALRDLHLEHPVGLSEPGATPYFAPERTGLPFVHVVGRSGEVVWAGNPVRSEKLFLEALAGALAVWPAAPLERELAEPLWVAVALYHGGEWDVARKSAERAAKRAKDPDLAEDANYLVKVIDDFERDLLGVVSDNTGMRHQLRLARLYLALERGLPRSSAFGVAEELVKEYRKSMTAAVFADALKWAELEAERPVLFPTRRDSAGKRFAKKIAGFVRNQNDTPLTRTVSGMLTHFESLR
jgi:hypothetical protein